MYGARSGMRRGRTRHLRYAARLIRIRGGAAGTGSAISTGACVGTAQRSSSTPERAPWGVERAITMPGARITHHDAAYRKVDPRSRAVSARLVMPSRRVQPTGSSAGGVRDHEGPAPVYCGDAAAGA